MWNTRVGVIIVLSSMPTMRGEEEEEEE